MKYNKSNIMKRAHIIRKDSNPRVTMSAALRLSWAEAKGGTKRNLHFEWTTRKGAAITLDVTVEHITRKTVNADGWPIEVNCDEWYRECTAMTVNGKTQAMHSLDSIHERVVTARQGHNEIGATLPADVVEAIYGEERRANAARLNRELAATAKYEAHCDMMRKAMSM